MQGAVADQFADQSFGAAPAQRELRYAEWAFFGLLEGCGGGHATPTLAANLSYLGLGLCHSPRSHSGLKCL